MKNLFFKPIVLMCGFLALGGVYFVSFTDIPGEQFTILSEDGAGEIEIRTDPDIIKQETASEKFIYVHVCGHVLNPGVYEVLEGSRLYEAIDAAGGVSEDGCADELRLAGKVADGDRIYVPGENESPAAAYPEDKSLVNINTAALEELMTLPGIGKTRAADIINYREDNGAFLSIQDIMKVSGIKEAAFNKIKDKIRV